MSCIPQLPLPPCPHTPPPPKEATGLREGAHSHTASSQHSRPRIQPQLLPHHTARIQRLSRAATAPQGHQLLPAISSPLAAKGRGYAVDSPGDPQPTPLPALVTVSVKENTPLQAVPTHSVHLLLCLFLPLRLRSVWRVCQGELPALAPGHGLRHCHRAGLQVGRMPRLGLQTAGLGEGRG